MPLTMAQIRGQIARLLRDNGLSSSQYSPETVARAINMACDHMAKVSGCTYKEDSMAIVSGKVTLPPSTITIVRVFYKEVIE